MIRLTSAGVSLIETKITVDSFAAARAVDELALPSSTPALTVPSGDYHFRLDAVLIITRHASDGDVRDTFQRGHEQD